MPKVSVIIPTYNCAHSVTRAVDSALAQTSQDFDIIVVDDGSHDNTREVLKPYSAHTKFHYIYQDNRGAPGARNTGAQASEAEYVAFLDADDLLSPRALELMTEALDASRAGWCLIDATRVRGHQTLVRQTNIPQGDLLIGILKEDFIGRCMFYRRRDFIDIGMLDESYPCLEDWDISIRLFEARKPFAYLNVPVYTYIWRQGSLITDRWKMAVHTERLLRKHHKRLADAGNSVVAKIYAQAMWDLARRYLYEVRSYKRAMVCMRESLAYDFDLTRLFHPAFHQLRKLCAHVGVARQVVDSE
jgi:glycosyltransferase involved in cell wall biosynthesis